jgi:NitT/TauT family transport system substrate-binding protein
MRFAMWLGIGLLLSLPAAAQSPLRVGLASDTWTFTPYQTAIDQGNFAKAGVTVQTIVFAGAAKLQQAMIAGAVDLALSGSTDFTYLVKGAPETAVAAFVGPPMGLGVIVSNPAYKTAADLRGKKIGVSSPTALTGWLALELAHSQGWPQGSISLVTLGGVVSAQGAALITGQVDAIVSDTALGYELEANKKARLLFPSSEYVPNFVTNVMYLQKSSAAAQGETLRRFLQAWYETARWMPTHKTEVVASARHITGLSEAVTARQFDDSIKMFSTDGHITPDQLKLVAQAVVQTGMIDSTPDLAPYYDPQFLPK